SGSFTRAANSSTDAIPAASMPSRIRALNVTPAPGFHHARTVPGRKGAVTHTKDLYGGEQWRGRGVNSRHFWPCLRVRNRPTNFRESVTQRTASFYSQ